MKILFLTTHNLASNPRLVKEIQLAVDNGFTVEVVCFVFRGWSFQINNTMIENFTQQCVKFHCIEAGREAKKDWLLSVIKEKIYRLGAKLFQFNSASLGTAVSRRSSLLIKALNKINAADFVVGHNPGALYPTIFAAKKFNCKAGFDVEDYHPGEGNNVFLQNMVRRLMQQVLPQMNYVSFAAPLIREAVKKDLSKEGANWVTVLNYFPAAEFVQPSLNEGPLKLVWFSQNISGGRGLELIIPAVGKLSGQLELHLYGNLNAAFFETYLKGIENVKIHEALDQKELNEELSKFDVGLALEMDVDANRNLCLTNKILAYTQAGLYVMATTTAAQQSFLKNSSIGECLDFKRQDAFSLLHNLLNKMVEIRSQKQVRFLAAQAQSWEKEAERLKIIWRNIFINKV